MSRPSISYLDWRGFHSSWFWRETFFLNIYCGWLLNRRKETLQDMMVNYEIWHYWQIWDWGWWRGVTVTQQFNLGAGVSRSKKRKVESWQAQHTRLPTAKATNMSMFPEKWTMWKQKCLAVGQQREVDGGEGRELWRFHLGEGSTWSQNRRRLVWSSKACWCFLLQGLWVRLQWGKVCGDTRHLLHHRKEKHLYAWQIQLSHVFFVLFSCAFRSENRIMKD